LIKEEFKTENNLIKDVSQSVAAGRAKYWQSSIYCDSDAILTKGIIAILIRVLIKVQLTLLLPMAFIDQIGLKEHLSPTRANS
jgi:cysteine desulfuration protein SufE